MKKWILVIFAVLWLFPAAAQSAREVILAQPDKAGGVYAMYEQEPGAESRPPKGYKPFYISHYGRHGARYLLSDKEYVRVLDLFAKAHAEGELTEAGENVHERLQAYYKQMQYRDGELSRYGWEQHQFIARQLYAAYPELFRLRPRVEAASTLYLRTLMSMNAFCTALQGCDPRLPLYAEGSRLNLNGICPHLKDNPFPQGEGVRFDIDACHGRRAVGVGQDGVFDKEILGGKHRNPLPVVAVADAFPYCDVLSRDVGGADF